MRPFHTFPQAGNHSLPEFSFNPSSRWKIQLLTKSSVCPFLLGRAILRNSYCTLELFCCPVLLGPHFAGAMWQGAFCRVGGSKKGGTGHMASTGRASSGKSAKNDPGIPDIRPGQLQLMLVKPDSHVPCISDAFIRQNEYISRGWGSPENLRFVY